MNIFDIYIHTALMYLRWLNSSVDRDRGSPLSYFSRTMLITSSITYKMVSAKENMSQKYCDINIQKGKEGKKRKGRRQGVAIGDEIEYEEIPLLVTAGRCLQ